MLGVVLLNFGLAQAHAGDEPALEAEPAAGVAEAASSDTSPGSEGAEASAETPAVPVELTADEQALVGVWVASDIEFGTLPGTLTLTTDRQATLAPAPIGTYVLPPLHGNWLADTETLRIRVSDKGEAVIAYTLSADTNALRAEYDNGTGQTFRRQISTGPSSTEIALP